jgi:integrase
MPNVELTDTLLRSLRPPKAGRLELRDSLVVGLVFRLTRTGTASWGVRARTQDGKQSRPGLGTWPGIPLKAARQQARILLGQFSAGRDPVAERQGARVQREQNRHLPTVAERLAAWQAARARDWSPRYSNEVARLCDKIIVPALGRRPLAMTERADWIELIAAQRTGRPATASWLYGIVSAFANYAETCGWIDRPLLPRKGHAVVAPKAPPRQRALTDDELAAVWHASGKLSPRVRCFVRLLILTACRVSEAAGIALGELDPTTARWTIPAARAKNGCAITVPLPATLAAELATFAPSGAGEDYCLLGAIKGSPLRAISRVKRNLDAASGVTDWTMHDARRTARTGLTRLGVARDHAEAAINHVSGRSALQRTYDVHDYAPEVIAALGVWQRHVADIIKPKLTIAGPA